MANVNNLGVSNQTINYVLDTYSEYIDNLKIAELKDGLFADPKIDYPWSVVHTIIQLIIDEDGEDVVNDFVISNKSRSPYFRNIVFNNHVNITKDNLRPDEFIAAVFKKGITINAKKLPDGVLSGAEMTGVVDLTQVENLGYENLFYRAADCIVKISNNLKSINMETFTTNTSTNVQIEYDGLLSEFDDLITRSISTRYNLKSTIRQAFGSLVIKCNDGDWTVDRIIANY